MTIDLFVATLNAFGGGGQAEGLGLLPVVMFAGEVLLGVLFAALSVLALVAMTFALVLTLRALGYWIGQFDVASWREIGAPLPFEQVCASSERIGFPVPPARFAPPKDALPGDLPAKTHEAATLGAEDLPVDSLPPD